MSDPAEPAAQTEGQAPSLPDVPKKFYVVWCPERGPFKVRHPARHFAEREARRLAALNPESKFFVLSAKSVVAAVEGKPSLNRLRRAPYAKPAIDAGLADAGAAA